MVVTLAIPQAPSSLAQQAPSGDVNRFVEQYQKLSDEYDPITLTSSERIHGWMSGDGLLAYLFMFEATQDQRYLREFTRDADRLLLLRDSERYLPDHRGLYLPAWRSEDTYLSAQVILMNAQGNPTLSFLTPALYRWQSSGSGQWRNYRLRVEHRGEARFDLSLILSRGHAGESQHRWEGLTMDPGVTTNPGSYAPRHFQRGETLGWRRQHNVFDLQAPGTPSQRRPVEGQFEFVEGRYNQITNTGTCSFPLAYFARLVQESPELKSHAVLEKKAAQYAKATIRAVAVHDDEWRENDRGEGWYIARQSAPQWSAGSDMPINQSNVLGLVMVELSRITENPIYRERATKLARSFKNDMEYVTRDDSYLWSYWLKEGKVGSLEPQQPEDLGHAGPNVLFVYWCYKNDIVFDRTDLQRIANTLLKYVIDWEDLTVAERIGGQEEGRADEFWRFLPLAYVDKRVYEFARDWAFRHGLTWLDEEKEARGGPADPVARRKNRHHRMRVSWATLAWVGSRLQEKSASQ